MSDSHRRSRQQESSDEEEELGLLGTPVDIPEDPEVSKKPIPLHEQVVTDDRGRRRFHGAFTGGFSAGYFNTVGSKEGKSSRYEECLEGAKSRGERNVSAGDINTPFIYIYI